MDAKIEKAENRITELESELEKTTQDSAGLAKQMRRDLKLLEDKNINLENAYKEIKETMEHFTADKKAEFDLIKKENAAELSKQRDESMQLLETQKENSRAELLAQKENSQAELDKAVAARKLECEIKDKKIAELNEYLQKLEATLKKYEQQRSSWGTEMNDIK
jgi:chromosome segregation ATPase